MKKILSLVAVAAIAYGVVSVAAASLTVTNQAVPQTGSVSISGGCAADAAVSYTLDTANSEVDAIVLTLNDEGACEGKTLTWKMGTTALVSADTIDGSMAGSGSDTVARTTASSDTVITYTYDTAVSFTTFNPASFSVTLY